MDTATCDSRLAQDVSSFVREGFTPNFGRARAADRTAPLWRRLRELGTELWLDTGSIEDTRPLWTREFSALTTNNTLLNREVQKGAYDSLIPRAADLLRGHGLAGREMLLEIAFILNARHALRLVEEFDAYVSVEEHTDLAHDAAAAVEVARRCHAICPERFIVKIPLTPAGLLATRRVAGEGIPVNHTLGFSARQNFVAARLARPEMANVFMGRLNAFVADNDLGDGSLVGERATLASQRILREVRARHDAPTRQIGASFRSGEQVRDLAGLDIMTMPPKVARGFMELGVSPHDLADRTEEQYEPPLKRGVDAAEAGLHTLWDVSSKVRECLDALEQEDVDSMQPVDLLAFFSAHGCGDLLVNWTDRQIATSAAEGKIPKLANWADDLASGRIGLDALMNLAGLNSFRADQQAMDERISKVLQAEGMYES